VSFLSEKEESFSPDSVRKKQKLKTILTIIGESLDSYFKSQIFETTGELPSLISIKEVNSIEKGTSKSKVHFVTYYLNTDIGEQSINLVVKFSADEIRYNKEIKNYEIISKATERFPGIYIPKIVYKSHPNRSIIYEGIMGKSFRETNLDKNFKYQLAGQTLILYLLSTLKDSDLEGEILESMLPSFHSLEKSLGSTLIHGDFHQGNLLFSSEATAPVSEIIEEFPPRIKVYIIDPEFVMPGRDRTEDIGTFFAKPLIKEFQKYGTFDETKKDISAFIKGYDFALSKMESNYTLQDLYSGGITIDFHVSSYILYNISEKIESKKSKLEDEDMQDKINLLRKILTDKLVK
jgi:thiamine kinase-like enzyme